MTSYRHLSSEERAIIMLETQNGSSMRAIARRITRSPSTISRERARQASDASYCATDAARRYQQNRQACVRKKKLEPHSPLYVKVSSALRYKQWSPEQISRTLKRMHPDDPTWHISPETIYASIYAHPRNQLKKVMIDALRQSKAKRGHRRALSPGGPVKVPEHLTIHQRPEDIEDRLIAGHWEGDLIVGAHNRSCIGTLVERHTGYVVLCKMDSKKAPDVRRGFTRQMHSLPGFLRQSMTYDRGSEMAEHPIMSTSLKMRIYFADPHAPWQRGSNENMNGLLRQYFPKGTDLSVYSQEHLNKVAILLNGRPRKRFDWKTPQELMDKVLEDHANPVALDS